MVKTRQLRRSLRRLGCRAIRQSGSHEVWECPGGTRLPVVLINEDDQRCRIVKAILAILIAQGLMPQGSEIRDLDNL